MKLRKGLPIAVAIASSLAGIVVSALPADAAGDTRRDYGCAAHWRNTAAWNECINSSGTNMQLQVKCTNFPSDTYHYGPWRYVRGSIDPADRHECRHHAENASNAYRP